MFRSKFFWIISFVLLLFTFNPFTHPAFAKAAKYKWSIIVFAGLDEQEIDRYNVPVVEEMLSLPLPNDTEFILQQDSFGNEYDRRVIRRPRSKDAISHLPEMDSANTKNFEDFIHWAKENARGEHTVFIVMTHSWGWKGIIQDYTVPRRPGDDTMMPLREFGRIIRENNFHPDVLFLDACILGTVEAIQELRGTSHYLIVSLRETPYTSYPYEGLFQVTQKAKYDPLTLAKLIPGEYSRAFARGGSKVAAEGEYAITTIVSLDMNKWDAFREDFTVFVAYLAQNSDFRNNLSQYPEWRNGMVDNDSNIDFIEFLYRIGDFTYNAEVKARAQTILDKLAYPRDVAEASGEILSIKPDEAQEVVLTIEADELLKVGTEDDPNASVLEQLEQRWHEANMDLLMPEGLQFSIQENTPCCQRVLIVKAKLQSEFRFRPWLAGTRRVEIKKLKANGEWETKNLQRDLDYFEVTNFPNTSLIISEAHSQGVPFTHGFGINLKPNMDDSEDRGTDPLWRLTGQAFYRKIEWNQKTGWADLILQPPAAAQESDKSLQAHHGRKRKSHPDRRN